MSKPLKQLPHVRTWITADGIEHSGSLIGQGFEARNHGVLVTDCPYDDKDPDGRCWWTMGWHRCDLREQKMGRGSLFASKLKRKPPPRGPAGPTMGIKP